MTILRALVLPCAVILTTAFGGRQTPARDAPARAPSFGTTSISGRVVNDASGQPLRRAVVSLFGSERNLRLTTVTDETGRFAFTELPDGRYTLAATKPGFVATNFGATRLLRPGATIVLASGERKTGLEVRMPPGAVITGTVRSRVGEPVEGARVSVLRLAPSYLTGERQLAPAGGGLGEATDDRGEYRVFGLPGGEYYVVATMGIGSSRNATELRETTASEIEWATRQLQSPGGNPGPAPETGRAVEYSPVFHPSSPTQAGASPVIVKTGEERRGVDVLLDLTPTGKITGQVVSQTGALPPTLQVNVIAHDTVPGIPFSGFGTARADAEGRFVSAGLPAGEYTITVRVPQARGGGPGAASLFGMATVILSGSDVHTTVTLGSGVTVSGRLVFRGSSLKPPENLTRLRVNLTAERGRTPTLGVPTASPDESGAFKFVGVTPGRYRLTAGGIGGWFVRSATLDGRDALDLPVEIRDADISGAEIVFTDQQSEISGDLLDASGRPAPEFFIIVYPADKALWVPQSRRIQSGRPAADGRFRFQNVPPGDYLIAAVTDVEPNEWFDPAFLSQLVGASTKIALGEGEKKVQSLRIKGS